MQAKKRLTIYWYNYNYKNSNHALNYQGDTARVKNYENSKRLYGESWIKQEEKLNKNLT